MRKQFDRWFYNKHSDFDKMADTMTLLSWWTEKTMATNIENAMRNGFKYVS